MEEKIISEFKIVETEDGYRIEIKGNKEQIKKMIEGRHFGFGHHGPFRRSHHHRGFGPFGFRGPWGGWGHGPWGWTDEEEDQPEQTEKA